MIDLENLYFDWLLTCLDPEGVQEEVAYLCGLLHNCEFKRRIGNDINRADDGLNLRREFLESYLEADLDPRITNELMKHECSWFEMLVSLSKAIDYLYDGGVEARFIELVTNMGLGPILDNGTDRAEHMIEYDQRFVDISTNDIDRNRFDENGEGGMFPLTGQKHYDQREVEIWDQAAAYFHERLKGVLF